jgi:hypothetical protein
MGALINFQLELHKLDKDKIIKGKKGTYYDITLSLSDTTNPYGYNVNAYDKESMEDRDAKAPRNYVGNGKVYWTDGNVAVAEKSQNAPVQKVQVQKEEVDLPF